MIDALSVLVIAWYIGAIVLLHGVVFRLSRRPRLKSANGRRSGCLR